MRGVNFYNFAFAPSPYALWTSWESRPIIGPVGLKFFLKLCQCEWSSASSGTIAPEMEGHQEMMGLWPSPFLLWHLHLYLIQSFIQSKKYLFKYLFTFYYMTHTVPNAGEITEFCFLCGSSGERVLWCPPKNRQFLFYLQVNYLMKLLLLVLVKAF